MATATIAPRCAPRHVSFWEFPTQPLNSSRSHRRTRPFPRVNPQARLRRQGRCRGQRHLRRRDHRGVRRRPPAGAVPHGDEDAEVHPGPGGHRGHHRHRLQPVQELRGRRGTRGEGCHHRVRSHHDDGLAQEARARVHRRRVQGAHPRPGKTIPIVQIRAQSPADLPSNPRPLIQPPDLPSTHQRRST